MDRYLAGKLSALACACLLSPLLAAQVFNAAPVAPTARLSLVSGAVEVQLPRVSAWQPAMTATPLQPGESLRTLESGRVEILLPGGSALRLIPGSQFQFTGDTSASVVSGTVFATLRKPDGDFSLSVGPHVLNLHDGFSGRIDAGKIMIVTVLAGKAELVTGKHKAQLESNHVATLRGSSLSLSALDAPPDPWTVWSKERDASLAAGLHNGVEPASLADYVNWYGQAPNQPSFAQGTGLTYAGAASCPWTVVNGDYQGWCWSEQQGWFLPVQPVNPAPQSASDANQAALMSQNASWADLGGWGTADPFFGPPCFIVNGLVQPFCLNSDAFGGFGFEGFGAFSTPIIVYEFVPTQPAGSGVRNARLGLPNPRQLGRHFEPVGKARFGETGLRRLAPPPRGEVSPAAQVGFRAASRTAWAQEGVRASHTRIGRDFSFATRNSAPAGFRASSASNFSSGGLGVRAANIGAGAAGGGFHGAGAVSASVSSGTRSASVGRTPH